MSNESPLSTSQLRTLKRLFPDDGLLLSAEETLIFGTDRSRKFAPPGAVVRPGSVEQVRELLAFAHADRIPISTRGTGNQLRGWLHPGQGRNRPVHGPLDSILEISSSDFVARVQPGVITGELQEACAAKRLFYPPDPASARFSTIGGNLAMNAGGMSAVKYGCTRDFVLGLTVVLPGGKVVRMGSRCHKDVAGLDMVRLFVGSEGTLGFIAEATLKLLPLPESQASLLVAVFQPGTGAGSRRRGLRRRSVAHGHGVHAQGGPGRTGQRGPDALARPAPIPACSSSSTAPKGASPRSWLFCAGCWRTRLRSSWTRRALRTKSTPLWEVRRQISQATFTIARTNSRTTSPCPGARWAKPLGASGP